ncbi:11S globulin seed storage protein G3-like [Bidens hawaiensis]|uniref:11S globulin seed storage protein G3-like n=1 Tax=Bidens hawaiensis TaxID=980011 RepID=UPI00404AA2CC
MACISLHCSSSFTIKPIHQSHSTSQYILTMASKACLLLAFSLFFATTCLARHQKQQQNQCQLQNIEPVLSFDNIKSEAGFTEVWDTNNPELRCAGVDFVRHTIQPGGLFLPSYVSAPILSFIESGQGIQGVILPGCPETYIYSPEQQFDRRGHQQFQFQDRHQKVENVNPGDVIAIPAGAAHWLHNNGDTELVVVVFLDTQNNDNQLDERYRRFFLAGNPQAQTQPERRHQQQYQNNRNIFNAFDVEFIAQVFNVDRETAEKLQGQNEQRGHIVKVGQDIQVIRPRQQGELYQGRGSNGFEETICSLKVKENIDNPSHADFVNPQAGRIANLNSFKFPLLKQLQLSVEGGELHPNATQSPHWTVNAHSLLYVTNGSLWVQIVNNEGHSIFDGDIPKGMVMVIPQNFAVVKRGGEKGARWVSFKTNDNAKIANLAGRVSAIRSLPVDVVANSYQLSREQAHRLKFSQRDTVLFNPSYFQGQQKRASA